MSSDLTSLRAEIIHSLEHTLDAVLPWFVSQMPAAYFADTPAAERLAHLRAILAARASGLSPRITLHSEDRARWTFLMDGDRPGMLKEILDQLPAEAPLRQVKVHTSADGQLAIDTIVLGDVPRFDPSEEAAQSRLDAILALVGEAGGDPALVRDFLLRSSADFVRSATALRAIRCAGRYAAVRGTEDTLVQLEPEDDPSSSRVVITVGNATPRRMFERCADLIGSHGVNIHRAFVDVVEDPGHGYVTLFSYLVRGPDGKALDESSPVWRALAPSLARAKWITDAALSLSHNNPALGLERAEVVVGLASLAHQRLTRENPVSFARDRVLTLAIKHLALGVAVADLLHERFDPAGALSDEAYGLRAAALLDRIEHDVDGDDARRVLKTLLDAVGATLRTNLHLEKRYGLALRLEGSFIPRGEEKPFGVYFVHGQGWDGFHLRFRDIARGGVRVVRPRGPDQLAAEADRLYDEVYGLAQAQQLKNKDIPEGGAKAVIVASQDVPLTRAIKGFIDGLLDLMVPDERHPLVDRLGRQETLYLGPDENITPEHIEWIVDRARRRGHKLAAAFMSSKPGAGINHKEYGVTSEGVAVFLDVALRAVGIDPRARDFTVKLTGGPDGDVAGNMLKILHREYGERARVVGIADGSGALEDPDGLDHAELLRLVHASEAVGAFDPAKLGPRGKLTRVEAPEGVRMRNTLHNRVVADAFVPSGGRPQTLNAHNWHEHLLPDGTPSSRVIVEGANLFLTPEARKGLGERGVLVLKDSSANKCGVICSSFEIAAAHLLSEEEFLEHKKAFVGEVIERLRELARREAELLFRERVHHPGVLLPELSVRLSKEMNRAADAIALYVETIGAAEHALGDGLVREHLPPTLRALGESRIDERLPVAYWRSIVAKSLAARIVYREGLDWLNPLPDGTIGAMAFQWLRAENAARALAATIRGGGDYDHAMVAAVVERAGARLALEG
ncbi:MAG: Glu/Leu/Phe/Val dehydrogenase [Myxococcaceae bacterium]|nr:Glu/Leu/Phe/Val dehydrogenase [Myxococcaceae bacterium]